MIDDATLHYVVGIKDSFGWASNAIDRAKSSEDLEKAVRLGHIRRAKKVPTTGECTEWFKGLGPHIILYHKTAYECELEGL